MSNQPSAPEASNYGYDQPPKYSETVQSNAGQYQSYGAVPQPSYYQQPPVTSQPDTTTVVLINNIGGCPACKIGVLQDDYTALGVLCAVLFFPLGILCCLAMKQRRCSNCGAIFG